jgi:hypothetical protein
VPGPSARPPKGTPRKVWRVANAIRRDNPKTSDRKAYRIAWASYHHSINRHSAKGKVKARFKTGGRKRR